MVGGIVRDASTAGERTGNHADVIFDIRHEWRCERVVFTVNEMLFELPLMLPAASVAVAVSV